MKKTFGIVGTAMTGAAILFWVASSAAGASNSGPHRYRRGGGRTHYSVPEPAAVVLLGAGLVALGIYAKRKNNKKP